MMYGIYLFLNVGHSASKLQGVSAMEECDLAGPHTVEARKLECDCPPTQLLEKKETPA